MAVAWGTPASEPVEVVLSPLHYGPDGTLLARTSHGRTLTFGVGHMAGNDGVLRRFGAVWRPASDDDLMLLGTHPDGLAFVEQHGGAIDMWIASPYTPAPPRDLASLTEAEVDRILAPDGDAPVWVEPPYHSRSFFEVWAEYDVDAPEGRA